MARKYLLISILTFLIMTVGYTNADNVPIQYKFILKFIVYSACYAMLLSWLILRQQAKGIDPHSREGFMELLKFSVFYASILIVYELPRILNEIARKGII